MNEDIWKIRHPFWPEPRLASVICPELISPPQPSNQLPPLPPATRLLPGDIRLYKTLMQEGARQIWKLRCERKIDRNDTDLTESEVQNRWLDTLQRRITTEINATHKKFGKSALKKETVFDTWENVVEAKTMHDPSNTEPKGSWIENTGVLVGIVEQILQTDGRGHQ